MTKVNVGDILRVKRDGGEEQDLIVINANPNGSFSARPLTQKERDGREFAGYLEQLVKAVREGKLYDWKIERKFNYGVTTDTNISLSFKGQVS
jgi:hypothetical protein